MSGVLIGAIVAAAVSVALGYNPVPGIIVCCVLAIGVFLGRPDAR